MVTLSLGTKKKVYKSIKEAAAAMNLPYMTVYMRYRKLGWKGVTAAKKPVRRYNKRQEIGQPVAV